MCPSAAGGDAGSVRPDGLIRSLSDRGRDSLQVCRRNLPGRHFNVPVTERRFPVRTVGEEYDPTWAKLVRTLVDGGQRLTDVVGQGVFSGEGVAAGVDLDGAVAA